MIRGYRPRRLTLEREAHDEAVRAITRERPERATSRSGWTVCETCYAEYHSNVWGLVCDCERRKATALERSYIEERGKTLVPDILEDSGLPRRFQAASFETFEERDGTADALAAALEWAEGFDLDTRDGLLFAGPFGSGKTHLAVAALRRTIERTLVEGRYISAGELVSQVRSGDPITWEPVERAAAAELLVLDDVGQEAATEFERGVVARVIMGRYDDARPTLFTSNYGPKGLEKTLGGAVVSRIWEMARTHAIFATDYRAKRRTAS